MDLPQAMIASIGVNQLLQSVGHKWEFVDIRRSMVVEKKWRHTKISGVKQTFALIFARFAFCYEAVCTMI